jgi:hypothetical protein
MSGPDQAPTGLLKIIIGLGIAEANEIGAGAARKKKLPLEHLPYRLVPRDTWRGLSRSNQAAWTRLPTRKRRRPEWTE